MNKIDWSPPLLNLFQLGLGLAEPTTEMGTPANRHSAMPVRAATQILSESPVL